MQGSAGRDRSPDFVIYLPLWRARDNQTVFRGFSYWEVVLDPVKAISSNHLTLYESNSLKFNSRTP